MPEQTVPHLSPAFTGQWLPARPRAITLVLHGGAENDARPVDGTSLSWQRGRVLARAVAGPLRRDGVGVVLLRYRVRGWNPEPGRPPAPVADATWALQELQRDYDLPIAVVGHSMGARTAVATAAHPQVRGVVALAPWLPPGDPVAPLTGKVLRAAHGSADRITSASATRAFVARAAEVADAEFTDLGPVGHYLLRRARSWHRFAVAGVQEILAEG